MLYRLDALLLRMRLAGTRLIRDAKHLKRDERGLSGAVVAILLILIAVLVVVAMWNSLSAQPRAARNPARGHQARQHYVDAAEHHLPD